MPKGKKAPKLKRWIIKLLVKEAPSKLDTPCWIIPGLAQDKDGYVRFWYTARLHRKSYELFRGPIPEGHHICHHCDNPPCINPDHLFAGTNIDNIKDCISKGRHTHGEKTGNAKLTSQQVQEIRYLFEVENLTTVEIAARLGISHTTIGRIAKGKTWRHIGPPLQNRRNRGNSHLTETQIIKIRALLEQSNLTQTQIASEFGVCSHTISNIKSGKHYSYLQSGPSHGA